MQSGDIAGQTYVLGIQMSAWQRLAIGKHRRIMDLIETYILRGFSSFRAAVRKRGDAA